MKPEHLISVLVIILILIILWPRSSKSKSKSKSNKKTVRENFIDETMREDNGTFSLFNWNGNSEEDNKGGEESEGNIEETIEVIENFPQTTPMNVIYTDASGNLSNTSDLGLQNLTITGNGALQLGSKFRMNANKDCWADDEWLRLSNAANTDYYGGFAAGKLWAQGNLSTDSLDVRSSGTVEKGLTVKGELTVKGDITAKSNISVPSGNKITVRDDNHAIGHCSIWGGNTRDGTTVLGWDGGVLASNNSGYQEALVWDNRRNVSVGNNLYVGGSVKIGNWTISENSDGNLVFNKNGATSGNNDESHIQMSKDGNLYLSRKLASGWVADNISDIKAKYIKADDSTYYGIRGASNQRLSDTGEHGIFNSYGESPGQTPDRTKMRFFKW